VVVMLDWMQAPVLVAPARLSGWRPTTAKACMAQVLSVCVGRTQGHWLSEHMAEAHTLPQHNTPMSHI